MSAGKEINDVYEKYKHLDSALCDREWLGEQLLSKILYDLWQVVRREVDHSRDIGGQENENQEGI